MQTAPCFELARKTAPIALAAVALSTPVAVQALEFDACMKSAGGASAAMLDCGKEEIARWDLRLNAAYRTLMTSLPSDARVRVQIDQRAWLTRHLEETARRAAALDDGSVAFLESQAFELSDLQQRTETLEARAARISRPAQPHRAN